MTKPLSMQAEIYDSLADEPERRALGFMDSAGAIHWRTREEMYAEASRCAAALHELGLNRGDVCLLVLRSDDFCAIAVLATLLIGAVPLLVAPPPLLGMHSNLLRVLDRTIRETDARLVVCDEILRQLEGRLARRPRTRAVFVGDGLTLDSAASFPAVAPAGEDIAAMQLTSGTTGFPRICVWKQKSVMAALGGMEQAMGIGHDDICFNWTPLYHDMGLVNNYFLCLVTGTPLVLLSPQEFVKRPALWLQGLARAGATLTWSPNFGFALAASRARESEIEDLDLSGVRAFWNAAERIHLETIRTFHERFAAHGVRWSALKTNFGCAENVGGATFSDPEGSFRYETVDRLALQEERIAIPIEDPKDRERSVTIVGVGRAAPGIEIEILSPSGEVLEDGRVGEVALRTPSRMLGYLNDPAATRRAIDGGHLRTGDLGYLRGEELFWVGRVQERITVAGKKLDPSDFEHSLLKVAGLREGCFAAFGVDDEEKGTQRIVVVSEVRDDPNREIEEIIGEVRQTVSLELGVDASDVVLVPRGTLTKTSSGKRRHRYFRDLYESGGLEEFRLRAEAPGETIATRQMDRVREVS